MDLWDVTKLVFRRWAVTVPLLLLTMASLVWIYVQVPPDYVATTHVQLIPPQVQPDESPGSADRNNPWAQLGTHALGQAVVLGMQRPSLEDELEAAGMSTNYTVSLDFDFPIVIVEVVGNTSEQATTTARHLTELAVDDVQAQQGQYDVSPEKAISTLVLDGSEPTASNGSKRRALVALAGLGVLLTAAASVAVDAIAYRRARRRQGRPARYPWPARYTPTPDSPGGPVAAGARAGGDLPQPLVVAARTEMPLAGRSPQDGTGTDDHPPSDSWPRYAANGSAPSEPKPPEPATPEKSVPDSEATQAIKVPADRKQKAEEQEEKPAPAPERQPLSLADDVTIVLPLSRTAWESESPTGGGR